MLKNLFKPKTLWLLCPLFACTGCSRAPSFEIIGSFLPSWMFCIAAALIATGLLRQRLVRRKLEMSIPALFVFYTSVAVALTCLLWLILFS